MPHLLIDPQQESALRENRSEHPLYDAEGRVVAYLIPPDLLAEYRRHAEERRLKTEWAYSLFDEEELRLARTQEAIYTTEDVLKLMEES